MKKILTYLKMMRIQHYIKNILIFLPILFSKNIFNVELLTKNFVGVVAFSLMTSVVYIINDIMDVDNDRKHEKKKNRPIALGSISISNASYFAIALLIISIALNMSINVSLNAYLVFSLYIIINILYSIKLKHVPIVDVTILASGFLIRVLYGSAITGIEISNWLYLTILSFSFYMGLGKRRNELKKIGNETRKVLEYYSKSFLDNNMYMCMALGIVFYSLWSIDINSAVNGLINVIWTIPFVIIICMKYSLNVEGDSLGDPVDVILSDKILFVLLLIYGLTMLGIIYF